MYKFSQYQKWSLWESEEVGASCSAGYITNIPMHECALLTVSPAGALIIKHFQNLLTKRKNESESRRVTENITRFDL